MQKNKYKIKRINDCLYEIPRTGKMHVPGHIYTSKKMLNIIVNEDESIQQVINVATLPGIQKYSLAMPDIHWGYGFPIGGVAAMDFNEGVISPGGVGYDINCGMRLATTTLTQSDIRPYLKKVINHLFNNIPTGIGSEGAIRKLNEKEMHRVLLKGSQWAIEQGFGDADDLLFTEENGIMDIADPALVSKRAVERGRTQLGTLGSGNHFLEIDMIDIIYLPDEAKIMGLFPEQIVINIHTGSRGCGYQICDDFLKYLNKAVQKYNIELPDRQLACAPIQSQEGQNYLSAMSAAANFAWANRQIIMTLARNTILDTLHISPNDLNFKLLYDVCHNIAKIETHCIDGKEKKVCLHRKGATRAFPPDHPLLPEKYQSIGQPVLVPGDMGRYSFICIGSEKAMKHTFGSTCHGAGRIHSRKKAKKMASGKDLFKELEKMGIIIQAKGRNTVAEEMPYVYKDVQDVVNIMDSAGISKKVARLKPLGVIKG